MPCGGYRVSGGNTSSRPTPDVACVDLFPDTRPQVEGECFAMPIEKPGFLRLLLPMTSVRFVLFVISLTLTESAHASYGQMRLDGLLTFLGLVVFFCHVGLVNLLLYGKLFRKRALVVAAGVVSLALAAFLIFVISSPNEMAGVAKLFSYGLARILLAIALVATLPYVLLAPIAQFSAVDDGLPSPRWVSLGLSLQMALVPALIALSFVDDAIRQKEFAAGRSEGMAVKAGDLSSLLQRAEQRRERIWATPWFYPWRERSSTTSYFPSSGWVGGMGLGLNDSPLIATIAPLGAEDGRALATLAHQYVVPGVAPNVYFKLVWDALQPGGEYLKFETVWIRDEMLLPLLERLESEGEARLCANGRMERRTRDILRNAYVARAEDRGNASPWSDYVKRVARICPNADELSLWPRYVQ